MVMHIYSVWETLILFSFFVLTYWMSVFGQRNSILGDNSTRANRDLSLLKLSLVTHGNNVSLEIDVKSNAL